MLDAVTMMISQKPKESFWNILIIQEFDRKHKLNWKFNSVLLIVFIRGIQTLIFSSLGDPKERGEITWKKSIKYIRWLVEREALDSLILGALLDERSAQHYPPITV